ncbi:disulfide bond formation protein DsbB [Enterobacter hormaechei subsp. oharae]
MFNLLRVIAERRTSWFLLAVSGAALESQALVFQHMMEFRPCVMCIYERVAVLGIIAAGIIGVISAVKAVRWMAIAVWIYSAAEGVKLAWHHTMLQLHPSPFETCDFAVSFPQWIPLDHWFPFMFVATGDCTDRSWLLLNMSIPQWLTGIFAVYLAVAILVMLSQIIPPDRRKK